VEIRPIDHDVYGTVYRVEIDGDPLRCDYESRRDAREAAEAVVGAKLEWMEEA